MCILFIVICHCLRGLAKSGIVSSESALYQIWDNYFYTFQVPVFFFVSGLFAHRSYDKLGFRRFLLTKIDALAYPYVVWQTLLLLLLIFSQGTANRVATPGQLLWFPLYPQALFWFVYTLMIVLVIYALARRIALPTGGLLAFSVAILFLPRLDWRPYNCVCEHLIYFCLGLLLTGRIERLCSFRPGILLAGGACCSIALLAIVWTPVDLTSPYRVLPALVGGAGVVLFSFALANWRRLETDLPAGALLVGDLRRPHDLCGRYADRIAEVPAHGQPGSAHQPGRFGLSCGATAAGFPGPEAGVGELRFTAAD